MDNARVNGHDPLLLLEDVEDGLKRCSRCLEPKPLDDFYAHTHNPDGVRGECVVCRRDIRLGASYGVTSDDYALMLKKQGGGCAGCGLRRERSGRHLAVDHDHETGAVRGLLCAGCNTAIGLVKEDPETLRALAEYLSFVPLEPTQDTV